MSMRCQVSEPWIIAIKKTSCELKKSTILSKFTLIDFSRQGKVMLMYQQQQNNLYPKGGRFCENNFWKFLIDSQSIIEGRYLICGR